MRITFLITLSLVMTLGIANARSSVNFETVSKGGDSRYQLDVPTQILEIYSQEKWETFWQDHTLSNIGNLPTRFFEKALPEVDFKRYFVVVAMDRIRGGGGNSIKVIDVEVDRNRLFSVNIGTSRAGSAAITTAEMNRPYHIIKIEIPE
jgi:hypothetical protein